MSKKLPKPPAEELKAKYYKPGVTLGNLASQYGTTSPTVRSWLKSYNISLKTLSEVTKELHQVKDKKVPSKEELMELYSKCSIDMLEQIFSVGQQTIYAWLEIYKIPRKTLSEACKDGKKRAWDSLIPTKEQFESEYSKSKNLRALERVFDLSGTSIKRLVKEYQIQVIKPQRSAAETLLFEKVQQLNPSLLWNASDRTVINPYELDMVCHEKKLAIEYCGLYWHSEFYGEKDSKYHLNKLRLCAEQGYKLITIFESDCTDKVLSIIRSKLGLTDKVHARLCRVKAVDSAIAKDFNDQYHMHGHHLASVHLGLFYGTELLMVLSMGKPRFNKDFEWECVRMTVKKGLTVVGGASKLFKHFRVLYNPSSIITYSDLRFGEGSVYLNCGFSRLKDTPANYWYYKHNVNKLYSRVAFQKHKLKKFQSYSPELTEWEIMRLENYDRIWDCGNAKYVWKKDD